jgi:hypothetical protein
LFLLGALFALPSLQGRRALGRDGMMVRLADLLQGAAIQEGAVLALVVAAGLVVVSRVAVVRVVVGEILRENN